MFLEGLGFVKTLATFGFFAQKTHFSNRLVSNCAETKEQSRGSGE